MIDWVILPNIIKTKLNSFVKFNFFLMIVDYLIDIS